MGHLCNSNRSNRGPFSFCERLLCVRSNLFAIPRRATHSRCLLTNYILVCFEPILEPSTENRKQASPPPSSTRVRIEAPELIISIAFALTILSRYAVCLPRTCAFPSSSPEEPLQTGNNVGNYNGLAQSPSYQVQMTSQYVYRAVPVGGKMFLASPRDSAGVCEGRRRCFCRLRPRASRRLRPTLNKVTPGKTERRDRRC